MFRYYLKLGLKSLRRAPVLTALIVTILAVGIGASMTSLTMLLVMSGDPIPQKSDRLFVPQLDIGPMNSAYKPGEEPERQMSWTDVENLLRDAKGLRQTALYGVGPAIDPQREGLTPFVEQGMATTREVFPMFDIPFDDGGPWSVDDDARGTDVVVIGRALAERVFGTERAVGRTLRLADRDYRVTGVMGDWDPIPRFYRINGSGVDGEVHQVWLPIRNAISREWDNNGWTNCNGDVEPGFAGFLKSDCTWLQYWVELESASDRAAFNDYLTAYVAEQQKLGRLPRPANNRLRNVREWLDFVGVVSNDTRMATWTAFGFLLVCLVNVVALMLAKFTARAGEIGVRRALGATRSEIFRQSLVEAGVLGGAGALLGLALAVYGVSLIDGRLSAAEGIYTMDPMLMAGTIALGLVAAVLAGLLPTWQACQVRPAIQLEVVDKERDVTGAVMQADLDALRALPGVVSAAWVNQVPLSNSGNNSGFDLKPDAEQSLTTAATYIADPGIVGTWGLRLVEGRDFAADEAPLVDQDRPDAPEPKIAIITAGMARTLYPNESNVVGRTFYWGGTGPVEVVGVVELLMTPWGRAFWSDNDGSRSVIFPARLVQRGRTYAVRVDDAAAIDRLAAQAEETLQKLVPGRMSGGVYTMVETRDRRYEGEHTMINGLLIVMGLLLAMTASGIVGLASLWVNQRRKQIGVRRALGARRIDIVRLFVTENLLITGTGVVIGCGLALALNAAMMDQLELSRLPMGFLGIGSAVLIVLGVAAVLGPALRAASVPPAVATRSA